VKRGTRVFSDHRAASRQTATETPSSWVEGQRCDGRDIWVTEGHDGETPRKDGQSSGIGRRIRSATVGDTFTQNLGANEAQSRTQR